MILGHLDQKLIFSDGAGRHFEFGPLAKNTGIFARGMGAKSFINKSLEVKLFIKTSMPEMVTEPPSVTVLI